MKNILPPNATKLEVAIDKIIAARLAGVPVAIDAIWNPATCPAALLPWLAWGLSLDLWNADWTEAQKRAAVADAIRFQQRKGTPASLRLVLDRFDPLIEIVEWFKDRDTMDPFTFRLELPLSADSDVVYDEKLVSQILRDIAQVKPVRAHMTAVYRMHSEAQAWLVSGAGFAGQARLDERADTDAALDPIWDSFLQTEQGEPLLSESRAYLEH
ncbi:phage tail protein I [Sphingobium sp. AR-3-1]|uniref:Phage tail protein I n=1 Tax=Sphingobium psychrophilum TaxID=2728834 RepID=A0A7X9ZQR1_9SPHN|nr:phage tail protein I [Sphingobium psychrophilum]NML08707.1 phage tail protein I [Sphingobium psychrophilum]